MPFTVVGRSPSFSEIMQIKTLNVWQQQLSDAVYCADVSTHTSSASIKCAVVITATEVVQYITESTEKKVHFHTEEHPSIIHVVFSERAVFFFFAAKRLTIKITFKYSATKTKL